MSHLIDPCEPRRLRAHGKQTRPALFCIAHARRARALRAWVLIVAFLSTARVVRAENGEDDTGRARAAFLHATELVRQAQWAEALTAFEQAAALRPHPVTTFNMAACERAMGRYTRARALFAKSLGEQARDQELPHSLQEEARAYTGEIERLLVRVTVDLEPADASVVVDGRPLSDGDPLVAGLKPAGPAPSMNRARFSMLVDPGAHIIAASRRGFSDAFTPLSLAPGAEEHVVLRLEALPAKLRVESTEPDAWIAFDGKLAGRAPLVLTRAPGTYRLRVTKDGFSPYEADVRARPGDDLFLRAPLRKTSPAITERWWFWTAGGVIVVGAALGTYFLTRPEPERPAVGGGTLGWAAKVP